MEFDEYAHSRQRRLFRLAWLVTGDAATAEDLVQETFVPLWSSWSRVRRADDPDAYARRVLVNLHISRSRRFWSRERPTADLPEPLADKGFDGIADSRIDLLAALRSLPVHQRAVVVLRYVEDLTEVQTAAVSAAASAP